MVGLTAQASHAVLFLSTLLGVLGTLVWALLNRDRRAISEFIVFLSVVALWTGIQLLEVVVGGAAAYPISFAVEALRTLMAVSWFYFSLTYAGYRELLYTRRVQFVAVVAFLYSVVFTAVPPVASTTTFNQITVSAVPFETVALAGETLHFHLTETVGYLFVLVGSATFVQRLARAGHTQWWQTFAIGGGIVGVVLIDVYIDTLQQSIAGIDYSAPAVATLTLLFIGTLYRDDLSNHVPIARMHVVESLDDPVIVLNPGGRIVDYNPAAEPFLTDPDPIGTLFFEATLAGLDRLDIDDAKQTEGTQLSLSVDAQRRYYDASATQIVDDRADGGVVVVFTDITELRERTLDLQRQSDQLDEFASIVSHDLRNPLTVARGRLELIDHEQTATIDSALSRMDDIIDDALTLAQEGQAIEERQWEPLRPIVMAAWRSSRSADATLTVEIDDDAQVHTDRSRLRTVFENLFRNAVDHGPDTVTVTVGSIADRGFYVEDTGPGIPTEQRDAIFEKGYTTGAEGSGLGLAIVRSIVAGHGWELSATEGTDGGARFEVTNLLVRIAPSERSNSNADE